jgi:ketosteroid isomerase-like protein
MTRDEVLAIIDDAYATRMRGDAEALAGLWAEGATFEIAGDASLIEAMPGAYPSPGQPALEKLMQVVAMTRVERLQALVEGTRAAILSRAELAFPGQAPFETLLYDLWELDEAGKVRSMLQFADTARIASEMQAMVQD